MNGVLDVWRQMADKGHSQRDAHVMTLREKAYNPRKAVQPKDLEIAIALWEKDVAYFSRATGERISEPNIRMMLTNMCPERLRYHLKLRADRLADYDDMKTEIVEWLAEEIKPVSRGGRVAAFEAVQQDQASADHSEEPEEELDEDLVQQLNAADPSGHLYALVRNDKFKKTKGCGKGGKGGKERGPRKCFECESTDHIAAACPVRAARVAKGGPERLDKPDVEMKGDKGKGKGGKGKDGKGRFQLTRNMWRGWNPGKGAQLPLTGPQWMNWMPPQGPQANSFQQQMFSPGYQLNSVTTKRIPKTVHAHDASAPQQHNRADVVRADPHGLSGCEFGFPCRIWKGIFEQKCFAESSKKMNTEKLSVFFEKRPMFLKLLSTNNEWEYIETILDSGATVTVIPPHVGRSYDVVPSAASRAGVKYEVANVEEIQNL